MKFIFIPKQSFKIGQIVEVRGQKMKVESYSHTGKNVIVQSLDNAPKFDRILLIGTDDQSAII
jgi:hypothetical protein